MKKRGWILLLAAVLLLTVGCGEKGAGKILSTEGVPQEVMQSAQYKAALAEETATVIAYNYEPLTDSAENQACRLCRELDFDLVLTGHQHMRVDGVRFCNSFAVTFRG